MLSEAKRRARCSLDWTALICNRFFACSHLQKFAFLMPTLSNTVMHTQASCAHTLLKIAFKHQDARIVGHYMVLPREHSLQYKLGFDCLHPSWNKSRLLTVSSLELRRMPGWRHITSRVIGVGTEAPVLWVRVTMVHWYQYLDQCFPSVNTVWKFNQACFSKL